MGHWKLVERDSVTAASAKKYGVAKVPTNTNANPKSNELYNLADAPAETKNVLVANAELGTKMKKLLNESRDRNFTQPGAGP